MTSRLLDLCRLGPCLAVVGAIVLLCGSSVLAPAQGDPLPKIGYLGFGAATAPTFFQKRMRELGYSEGKDVEVEYRFADGRPEKLPALGTLGDLMLIDPSLYVIGDRQMLEIAASEHVNFLKNQMTWRVVERIDGQPWMDKPITLQDASSQVSPFVALN